MTEPPRRWLDDPELDGSLRAALEAGRDELPSDAQLASLAERLGPLLGPGGGPGGGGGGDGGGGGLDAGGLPAASGAGLAAKAAGALLVAAALGGGAAWMATSGDPSAPPPVAREVTPEAAPAPEPAVEDPPPLPEGIDPPEIVAPAPGPARPAPPAPRAVEADPAAELALIRRAQAALRTDPAAALAEAEAHARRFGDGALAQEREVVAIDALSRLGRADAARARADRFHARWPRSAHRRRIEVITGAR